MPTLEWSIPFELVTLFDDTQLLLNQPDAEGRIYRLNGKNCTARRAIRATNDPKPQGDGDVHHKRWSTGYEIVLAIQLWEAEGRIACDDVLCEMRDELYGHLWSLMRPQDHDADGGRVIWTPSCGDRRMLDAVKLLAIQDPQQGDDDLFEIVATLDTPFPYAISVTQDTVPLNGLAGSITNGGNVPFWPVIKLYGDGATIVNNTTGKQITMAGGCLGGGSYIEIDTFRGTFYVDGDQANAKPCVNVMNTDLIDLWPGANQIDTTAYTEFLVNDAWA